MHWIPAYIGLGSNLADPQSQVEQAFTHLAAIRESRLIARSNLYRTRPLGPQDQPNFINAAAGVLTRLGAQELYAELDAIQRAMGKKPPAVRWGPRVIDLDLLLYGTAVSSGPGLTLPHPGIHERNFVLYPLADIAPAVFIPGRGTVSELAAKIGADGLQPVH